MILYSVGPLLIPSPSLLHSIAAISNSTTWISHFQSLLPFRFWRWVFPPPSLSDSWDVYPWLDPFLMIRREGIDYTRISIFLHSSSLVFVSNEKMRWKHHNSCDPSESLSNGLLVGRSMNNSFILTLDPYSPSIESLSITLLILAVSPPEEDQ